MTAAGAPEPEPDPKPYVSGPPVGYAVPDALARLAGGPVTLVWRNVAGGLTGRVDGPEPRFIKWNPAGSGESLAAEAERMRWLADRHPAPRVIDLHVTAEEELLVTAGLPGRSAVDPEWLDRPDEAVRAIAEGLRTLHALPPESCPFDWGVAARVRVAASRGIDVPHELRTPPPIDRLVVCHGDACAPNTLLDDAGRFLATMDVGRLGLADRWADLAAAVMSLGWNYPEYDEDLFWRAYGAVPDRVRLDYYQRLWDAT